jgi:polyisoprenoid-binding protein YceI
MKKLGLFACLLLSPSAFSAVYALDPTHTTVGFEVIHLGISKVPGKFKEFKGTFEFDEKTQTLKDLNVEIKTASINTENTDRDGHLKGADFFNVEKFPVSTFKITKPVKLDGKPIKGELTLLGKTQNVTLNVKYNGSASMSGTQKTAFDAQGKIDRTQFGMTWNKEIEAAQKPNALKKAVNKAKDLAISNEVAIIINVEANQEKTK